MLIDDVKIVVQAGAGGNGTVAFNTNMMSLGPTGASGGNGGNVWLEGVADIGALRRYRNIKSIVAENGQQGKAQFNDGRTGKDTTAFVPVGTVIHNLETGQQTEILSIGQRICVAKGGRGGRGNFHFRSSTNTSPKQFERGTPGEVFTIRLELKLIADVGLIGLPNAGKSSLLNTLTNSKSKVGNYRFTTLEPNLGAYYDLILADIPGLIEGAASGKGLGIKFLRHIERTGMLLHLIAADSEDILADYRIINKELNQYSPLLAEKTQHILLTKTDLLDNDSIDELKIKLASETNRLVIPISLEKPESLKPLHDLLVKQITVKKRTNPF